MICKFRGGGREVIDGLGNASTNPCASRCMGTWSVLHGGVLHPHTAIPTVGLQLLHGDIFFRGCICHVRVSYLMMALNHGVGQHFSKKGSCQKGKERGQEKTTMIVTARGKMGSIPLAITSAIVPRGQANMRGVPFVSAAPSKKAHVTDIVFSELGSVLCIEATAI